MGILIAGGVAIVIAIWLLASLSRLLGYNAKLWLLCVIVTLPLSPIANLAIKKPLLAWIGQRDGVSFTSPSLPLLFTFVGLTVVGISEEAVKIVPLTISRIRRTAVSRQGILAVALSLGFGFGISEVLYLVWAIWHQRPDIARLPFYELAGFTGERVAVMFLHAGLVLIPVSQLAKGWLRFTVSLAFSMFVHALVDLPAALFQAKRLGYLGVFPWLMFMLLICYWIFVRPLRRTVEIANGRILYTRSERKG